MNSGTILDLSIAYSCGTVLLGAISFFGFVLLFFPFFLFFYAFFFPLFFLPLQGIGYSHITVKLGYGLFYSHNQTILIVTPKSIYYIPKLE